ncbi:MAG: hypothetical protein ABI442_19630 [Gemmatimonadaceae bacterium]
MTRTRSLAVVVATAIIAVSHIARAQAGISVGVGGGVVGSTESSLSDGKSGAIGMVAVTKSLLPLLGLGAQVDFLRRSSSNTVFGTGFVKLSLPVLPFSVKLGAGFGSGDPDGNGSISGAAGLIGLTHDITLPAAPIAFTVFGNALLAHGSSRYLQMADIGLALTLK